MAENAPEPYDPKKHTPYLLTETYYGLPAGRQYADVRKVLNIKDEKGVTDRIGRAIKNWEERVGVLHIVLPEDGEDAYAPLLPELEDKLREHYGLRDVVVVDTARIEKDERLSPFEKQDRIHHDLGKWGGRILASQIRPGDVVGIGGGRGVEFSISFCRCPRRHPPQSVVSLTGRFPIVGRWDDEGEQVDLDSDVIIAGLAGKLGTPKTRSVGAYIADKQTDARARERLDDNQQQTTVALIGIGALGGGHRLVKYPADVVAAELSAAQGEMSAAQDEARKAREETKKEILALRELINVTDKKEPPLGGHWVGDISNCLFVVGGNAPNDSPHNDLIQKLNGVVGRLNEKFLSTPPEVFQRICARGAVIAVAGGEQHKTSAIHHVLSAPARGEAPWITHLITDSGVARKIINALGL